MSAVGVAPGTTSFALKPSASPDVDVWMEALAALNVELTDWVWCARDRFPDVVEFSGHRWVRDYDNRDERPAVAGMPNRWQIPGVLRTDHIAARLYSDNGDRRWPDDIVRDLVAFIGPPELWPLITPR